MPAILGQLSKATRRDVYAGPQCIEAQSAVQPVERLYSGIPAPLVYVCLSTDHMLLSDMGGIGSKMDRVSSFLDVYFFGQIRNCATDYIAIRSDSDEMKKHPFGRRYATPTRLLRGV